MRAFLQWLLLKPVVALAMLAIGSQAVAQIDTSVCKCGSYGVPFLNHQSSGGFCEEPPYPDLNWNHYKLQSFCCEDNLEAGITAPTVGYCAACVNKDQSGCTAIVNNCDFQKNTCNINSPIEEICDGLDSNLNDTVDEGCMEHGCSTVDKSEQPVRFSSGHVETNVIPALDLWTPADVPFGIYVRWGSHHGFHPVPAIDDSIRSEEDSHHFLGKGWFDAYSDRLYLHRRDKNAPSVAETPSTIVWQSFHMSRTFTLQQTGLPYSRYTTANDDFELRDYGSGATPRYQIIRAGAIKIWEFNPITFTTLAKSGTTPLQGRIADLSRIAIPADTATFDGGYEVNINRVTNSGKISNVYDSLGRELSFTYTETSGFTRLATVSYRPSSSLAPVVALTFSYHEGSKNESTVEVGHNTLLDRIAIEPEFGNTYYRFSYRTALNSSTCKDCYGLLLKVIVPDSYPLTSAPYDTARESVLEGHEYYDTSAGAERARAKLSYGLGRRWAYRYDLCFGDSCNTRQFDLNQPQAGASCSSGCGAGYDCYTTAMGGDGTTCYAYIDHNYFNSTRAITATYGIASGRDGTEFLSHTTAGFPTVVRDAEGRRNTISFDSQHRPVCMVMNDDNDVAGQNPAACDVPSVGAFFWTSFAYSGLSTTQRRPGVLSSTPVQETTTRDPQGRTLSRSVVGQTRQVASATPITQTRTKTFSYSPLGQLLAVDGPLNNTSSLDVTEYVYKTAAHGDPNGIGQLHEVRRKVGTSASFRELITRYENYDLSGTPTRITDPAGIVTTLSTTDRIDWSVNVGGSVWKIKLNPTGTIRTVQDPDGVCLLFEYSNLGPLDQPIRIKRSAASAGLCSSTLPIDIMSGEVEVRTYAANEGDRLIRVERRLNGSIQFSESYTYDVARRVTGVQAPTGATPSSLLYSISGIMSESLDPNCGVTGAPCGRTQYDADGVGRPSAIRRFLDATNFQSTTLGYSSGAHFLPTSISRGRNGSATITSSFVYDDFGQVVEVTTPDAGLTRYEYDAAGNMILERVGVGTAIQRTNQRTYDSLGRVLAVDYDLEHPVNCATAPAWTPISDEVYRYDDCDPADTPSGAVCGGNGQLTVAKVILSCDSQGSQASRGTWYGYNSQGQIQVLSIAYRDASGFDPREQQQFGRSPAGRLLNAELPFSGMHRVNYARRADDGNIHNAHTPLLGGDLFVAQEYAPFGRLKSATQPGTGTGGLYLNYSQSYLPTSKSFASTYYSGTYDAGGFLTSQPVTGSTSQHTRYFLHDELGRLTCETTTSATTCPSSTSSSLKGSYGFTSGLVGEPPDNRRLVAQRVGSQYSPGVTETYTFAAGSNRISTVQRPGTNGSTEFTYDALGRRTMDRDLFDAVNSRRDYTYLPNGRLGTISGRNSSGQPYSFSILYDADARPFSVVKTVSGSVAGSYDYYYDLEGNLFGARVVEGFTSSRWMFLYADGERFGAIRDCSSGCGGGPTLKRYIFINDLRGHLRRVIDANSMTYFQSDYLASGWRQPEVTSSNTFFPFSLPGQIVLDGTEARASGLYNYTRPPIHLNHHREYDPFTGAFIEPDPLDSKPRHNPEGFAIARLNPLAFADPSGLLSISCDKPLDFPGFEKKVVEHITTAALKIARCVGCDLELRRAWLYQLYIADYRCKYMPGGLYGSNNIFSSARESDMALFWSTPTRIDISLKGFNEKEVIGKPACLENTLAAEAFHAVSGKIMHRRQPSWWVRELRRRMPLGDEVHEATPAEEDRVHSQTNKCVTCD
jgi:RHS repeat-associated protein